MGQGKRKFMNLRAAYNLAHAIREQLAPYCEPGRCEVVGSIRRAREHVNDIDLALIPKAGQMQAIKDRCLKRAAPVKDGEEIFIVGLKDGTQLDIYFAHGETRDLVDAIPTNWGSVLLLRTGSKEHNIYVNQVAAGLGLKWGLARGIVVVEESPGRKPGQLIASATEEEMFAALNMEFVPPAMRER
jgi:DNA polymerase (family X)